VRQSALLAALGLLAGGTIRAQERVVSARVVQIAGANVYLDVGATAGLRSGDTLGARRTASGPRVGTLAVLAVTEERSMVGFVGRPFPITRGDTVLLAVRGPSPAPSVVVAPVAPAASRAALRRAAAEGATVRGSLAAEVLGTRTTTVGFGADPERVTRDYAVPSLRLQATATNLPGGGRLILSARGSQQTGTTALFDRSTVVRVYDAHYEQEGRRTRVMVGRFYSPYERFSGSWDGALLRFGGPRGLGAGLAAGFQPRSGDEAFSTSVPKVTAFAGLRSYGARVSLDADLSAHVWRPQDGTADRTFVGWSQRLRMGGARLEHLVEVDQSAGGGWSLTRLNVRTRVPLGSRLEAYAEYWRDRLHWWDPQPDSLIPSRERASGGLSYRVGAAYVSVDATLQLSGADVQGHTYSGSLHAPLLGDGASFAASASYWTQGTISGMVMTPTLGWRLGAARPSLTYEFFRSSVAGSTTVSHGGTAAVSLPLGRRLEWLLRLTARYGQHLRSAGLYSSLRVMF
jgi:hypothetical protein